MTYRNKRRIIQRNEKELIKYISMFVEDCKSVPQSEWRSIFNRYDTIWMDNAKRINHTSEKIVMYADAFEASILNGYELITDRSDKQVNEIFYYFKKKTLLERLKNYLKNYYAKALD